MSLIGNMYIEASDPGAVGCGYLWTNTTTGDVSARDTTNTLWNVLYNVNQANGGLVPVSGANMSGALTGVTGWAPNDSPNFTTTAKLMGINLATTNDLASLLSKVQALVASEVSSALASSATTSNMYAFGWGYAYDQATIPLPVYDDDGTQATLSQVKFVLAAPAPDPASDADGGPSGWGDHAGLEGGTTNHMHCHVDPTTLQVIAYVYSSHYGLDYCPRGASRVQYIILCRK